MFQKEYGFTLVELAIALMVIGLLIGGVLKGQELIENARITTTVKQISDLKTAIMIFSSTYGKLPGDIKNPAARVPNCADSPCRDGGNGNGIIDPSLSSPTGNTMSVTISTEYGSRPERKNFFRHMAYAGLLHGFNPPNNVPTIDNWRDYYLSTPYDNSVLIAVHLDMTSGFKQNTIYIKGSTADTAPLPARAAAAIDRKMDDGKPWTGSVFTMRSGPSTTAECVVNDGSGGRDYAESKSTQSCSIVVGINP